MGVLWKQNFIFKHAKFNVPIRYSGGGKKAVRQRSLAMLGWRYRPENPQLSRILR